MIIDCHAHLVPPSLLDAIRAQASGFPSIRLIEDGGSLGIPRLQEAPIRDVWKVVVAQRDDAEPALLMAEGAIQRVLLRTAGAGVGEPAPQVHLPGHERDQRDHAGPGAGLDRIRGAGVCGPD